eukprot:3573440-Rhodomonas_salina.2
MVCASDRQPESRKRKQGREERRKEETAGSAVDTLSWLIFLGFVFRDTPHTHSAPAGRRASLHAAPDQHSLSVFHIYPLQCLEFASFLQLLKLPPPPPPPQPPSSARSRARFRGLLAHRARHARAILVSAVHPLHSLPRHRLRLIHPLSAPEPVFLPRSPAGLALARRAHADLAEDFVERGRRELEARALLAVDFLPYALGVRVDHGAHARVERCDLVHPHPLEPHHAVGPPSAPSSSSSGAGSNRDGELLRVLGVEKKLVEEGEAAV